MKNETQSEFAARYTHIKLHSRCLWRLTVDFIINGRISMSMYIQKSWFFIKGITRALQPSWYRVSEMPMRHTLLDKMCSQPSGSLMASSSLTLTQV